MATDEPRVVGSGKKPDDSDDVVLQTECHAGRTGVAHAGRTGVAHAERSGEFLGELAKQLALVFGVSPIAASAVIEHVFQALIQQFYEKGECYFPNFGWIRFENDGHTGLLPNEAFKKTLERMEKAVSCRSNGIGRLGLIDQWLEQQFSEKI